jgi:2-phosphoglycerate kinase
MRKKLIFIGGAPGVGKSTAAGLLLNDLNNSVWLDGDDLWRMNPFIVDGNTKRMVEKNISFVLNSFLKGHFSYILFTWVLHLDSITHTILSSLEQDDFDFMHFTLTCDEKTLKDRISNDAGRTTDSSLAIKRLNESRKVKSLKIDTADKTPLEIASALKNKVIS